MSFPFPLPENFLSKFPPAQEVSLARKSFSLPFTRMLKLGRKKVIWRWSPYGKMSLIYPNELKSTLERLWELPCLLSSLFWWKFDSSKFEQCELCLVTLPEVLYTFQRVVSKVVWCCVCHLQAHQHTYTSSLLFLVPCTFLFWYSPACPINNTAHSGCWDSIQPFVVVVFQKNITKALLLET